MRRGQNLPKHHLLLLGRGSLKLLLNKPRAMLIHTELDKVINDVAQLQMRLSIGAKVLEESATSDRRATTAVAAISVAVASRWRTLVTAATV